MTDQATTCFLFALLASATAATATCQGEGDWPAWGRTAERNFAAQAEGLPSTFVAGEFIGASDRIDFSTTENVRWIAKLGSQSYGNPTVANGRVYVGTMRSKPWPSPGSKCSCPLSAKPSIAFESSTSSPGRA